MVGFAGSTFHLLPLWKDIADEEKTWGGFEGALSLAPPVFAPLAFVGVGMLLVVLASPRIHLRLRRKDLGLRAESRLANRKPAS